MKLTKKKILIVALAVCLLAVISVGTLAWFTDSDEVTNSFQFATSADDADGIFSVDVWEDDTKIDTDDEEKIQTGIKYDDLLPGDNLYKEVNVENTGHYDQYIRVTVTLTDAHVWQEIFGTIYVPLNALATDLNTEAYGVYRTVYDATADTMTYVLYYNGTLSADEISTLFTNVHIPEQMDRFQAAELSGNFRIDVFAEAVQTKNVGDNAIDAFKTVNKAVDPGNYIVNLTAESLAKIFAFLDKNEDAVLSLDLTGITVDAAFNNKATLTITGGTFNNPEFANVGTLTLIGTTVNGDVANVGTLTVTNGVFNGDIVNDAVLSLTDAEVNGNVTNNDTLTVVGGSIDATAINNGNRARPNWPGRPDPQPAAKGFVVNNGTMTVANAALAADDIKNDGDLTLTDTALMGNLVNNDEMTVTGGTVNVSASGYGRPGRPDPDRPDPKPEEEDKANVTNKGTMALTACIVVADEISNDGTLTLTDAELDAEIVNDGTLTATNGTVNSSKFTNNGDMTLSGTAVNGTNGSYAIFNNGTAVFNDVDVTSAAGGIEVKGTATFNSGKIDLESDKNSQLNVFNVSGKDAKLVINGGEFSFNTKKQRTYVNAESRAVVEINGGTFGAASSARGCEAISESGKASVTVKGGTFGFDPSEWVPRGYKASKSYSHSGRIWTWTVRKSK